MPRFDLRLTAGCVIFVFLGVQCACAGPVPMPLEAQIDLASDVVVGQITKIDPVEENNGPGSHGGRATIQVSEALKGSAVKTIQCFVITSLDPGWQGAASPEQHKVGAQGIWVIQKGRVEELISGDRRDEIRSIVKTLDERKWSPPVNGLSTWAMMVPNSNPNPVIIFAVKNVSDSPLYVPSELQRGFMTATVTDLRDENVIGFVLRPEISNTNTTLFCHTLQPGEVNYYHPNYTSIDLAWHQHLGPGKYSVVISCENYRTDGRADDPQSNGPVKAWTGQANAPAVQLEINAKP